MLKRLAMIFGAIFVLIGLLGFVPNPLVGANGFFLTNVALNIAHLLIGAILIIASTQSERAAWVSLFTFGAVYVLLAVLGYATIGAEGHTQLLGIIHVNGNDTWLHILLGVVMMVSAFGARGTTQAYALR